MDFKLTGRFVNFFDLNKLTGRFSHNYNIIISIEIRRKKSKVNKKFFILVLVILMVFTGLNKTAAENLSFEEVLELGLKNNIQIKNSKLDYEIAEKDYEIARRNLFPQISLESSYTRMEEGPTTSIPIYMFQSKKREKLVPIDTITREGPQGNYSTSISINQPLYAGGRIRLGVDQAEQGKELTKIQSEQKESEILFQIIQSFYNLLMAEDRVQIEKDALELVQEHKRIARSSFEAGTAIKTDVLKAEIEESKARQRLLEAQNQLSLARERLGNLIGIEEQFSISPPQQEPELELEFKNLLEQALNNRPEFQSLQMNQKLTKTKLELEEKSFYPSFYLNGNYSQQGSDFSPGEGSWTLTISGSMSLYQGGKSSRKQSKIKKQLQQLKQQQSSLKQNIKLEVRQKIMAIEENKQNIKVQNLNLTKAQENLELENKRFKTGVGKSVEVLNAQTTLKQTRISASQAELKYEQSLYELLQKIGKLTDYVEEVVDNE
uniref:Outer membrane efflux protein n=1 Tax=uncultured organism TaxID=155900 RepID=M1QBM6_9ZZZZ|nr:outer membrane efflux protein [uncultured organism]